MTNQDPTQLSLTKLDELISTRRVSPVELTEACIERCERLDPRLHAFITPTFETARREATAAAEAIAAGRYLGPLHGIPFGLKDLYDTAGVLTTAGSPLREEYLPAEDAHVVKLLKQAGMVLLGKLTMHELALGGTSINQFFPTPRNPWNLDHIAGGSSGGSATAVSAGLCIGALGSDTRGSIRMPAAMCGITGLKPTYGRVSLRGVVPLNWSLDHAGPMARTASDCALILQAIAGYDDDDPTSEDRPVPDYTAHLDEGVKGLRIGVPENYFFDEDAVAPEIIASVCDATAVFASLGAELKPVVFPGPELFGSNDSFLADAAGYHEVHLNDRPEAFSDGIRGRLSNALSFRAVDYSRARYEQLAFKQALRRLFREIDLLIVPTLPMVAPSFADAASLSPSLLPRNTGPFSVAGVPVISLPCGFDGVGLPIGLSLAGRAWEEETVLRAAHAYQQATDWHQRRPPID